MRISALIRQLEKIQEQHGDIFVEDDTGLAIHNVIYNDQDKVVVLR